MTWNCCESIFSVPIRAVSLAFALWCASASATTYYVSSHHGKNSNNGTSEATAWADFAPVNGKTFAPGDRILLERGSVWNDTILSPKGSGEPGKVIAIASYGTEKSRPVINANGFQSSGNGATSAVISDSANYPNYAYGSGAVTLFNQQYWEIYDLELTNKMTGRFEATDRANNFSGIRVWARGAGAQHHIYIRGNFIHDVTGEVSWSGDRAESKRTGGIVVYTWDYNSDHAGTRYDDVRIEKNHIQNVSMEGIAIQQAGKTNKFANRMEYGDNDTYIPFTNVVVSGNVVFNPANPVSSDGIQLIGVSGGHVFDNLVVGGGCVGIETDANDNTLIEYNEVSGVRQHYVNGGGIDHAGIDIDAQSSNTVAQFNYVHDNGEGIIVDAYGFGYNNVVRYNLLVNNDLGPEGTGDRFIPGDGIRVAAESGTTYIYNNTVYSSSKNVAVIGSNQPKDPKHKAIYYFQNNILVGGKANWPGGARMESHYSHNDFFGFDLPNEGDDHAMKTDPGLIEPGTTDYSGTAGKWPKSVLQYRLKADSAMRGAGTVPVKIKGKVNLPPISTDFFRQPLSDPPNIGFDGAAAPARAADRSATK